MPPPCGPYLFTRPYGAPGPSAEQWRALYNDAVHVQDPTNEHHGIDADLKAQQDLLGRCDDVLLKPGAIAITGDTACVDWEMGLKIRGEDQRAGIPLSRRHPAAAQWRGHDRGSPRPLRLRGSHLRPGTGAGRIRALDLPAFRELRHDDGLRWRLRHRRATAAAQPLGGAGDPGDQCRHGCGGIGWGLLVLRHGPDRPATPLHKPRNIVLHCLLTGFRLTSSPALQHLRSSCSGVAAAEFSNLQPFS